VFGILFTIISTATTLVREDVSQTLRRLRLTQAKASHMLLGVGLAQMLIVLLQIPLAFGLAVACGFGRGEAPMTPGALLLAAGIGLLLAPSAIGAGLMTAALARNDGEATSLGTMLLVPLAFLSGAIYPMPQAPIGAIAGHAISAYDVLPAAPAAEAMRQVLVLGAGPGDILYELAAVALGGAVYLAVGIVLYQALRLRRRQGRQG
jgi:ABC-2 type transport system permease protein